MKKKEKGKTISVFDCIVITFELILILVVTCFKMSDKPFNVFGYNLYSIATESMTPVLKVNDVIISKEYNEKMELKVGDIITYEGKVGSYAGKKITHRINEIYDSDGITYIITKGDAADNVDPVITTSDVLAKMTHKLTLISLLYKVVAKPIGFVALIIGPILILLISTIIDYIKSLNDSTNENKDDAQNIKVNGLV